MAEEPNTPSGEKQETFYLPVRWETGSSKETQLAFQEKIFEKYGVQTEIVRICDSCKLEMNVPNPEEFACRLCGLSFDLCEKCQDECPYHKTQCPASFGCSLNDYYEKDREEMNKIFVRSQEKKDTYTVFGKEYRDVHPKLGWDTEDSDFFLKDYNTVEFEFAALCESPPSSLTSPEDSEDSEDSEDKEEGKEGEEEPVSWKFIHDMWVYFRSSDQLSKEKYGLPLRPIFYIGFKERNYYKDFEKIFKSFLKFDCDEKRDETQPLLMCFVYPNGDEFIIKRLSGEERVKRKLDFLSIYMLFSKFVQPDEQPFNRYPTDVVEKVSNNFSEKLGRKMRKFLYVLFGH